MPISGQRHSIHLYIRSIQGSVSFMELDVSLVEQVGLEWGGDGAQRDQARMQEIMRQITQNFPKLQVAGYRTSIAALMTRLSSAKDGAALGLGFALEGQNRFVHLYIRPTQGPISFMELDIDLIEWVAVSSGGAQRDQTRVREIMRQITQKFPGVQVASYQTSIATLVARLSTAREFAAKGLAFVLEVPGNIQQPSEPPTNVQPQEQTQGLEEKIIEKDINLKKALAAYGDAQREVVRLKNELRLLQEQQSMVSQRNQHAQQQVYQANQRINQLQLQLATQAREIEMYGYENGDLKTRYEGLEMKYTTLEQDYKGLEARFEGFADQVSVLRDERNEAVQAKQQLEQALQDRDEEIRLLNMRLQTLTMGAVTEANSGSGGSMMLG